ncbi:hypothetical protein [Mesorhizobium sp. CAU 1741]|uniref:hypothetical protein n=1 Tax=Mesorhizobium sp. CAU 1741 TaxID=3140366 RepID=UPI00325AA4AE
MCGMNAHATLSSDDVRQHLLAKAKTYAERTGASFSHISEAAVNDSKFLANVERGSNFTIRTYQRVLDWLDERAVVFAEGATSTEARPASAAPAQGLRPVSERSAAE